MGSGIAVLLGLMKALSQKVPVDAFSVDSWTHLRCIEMQYLIDRRLEQLDNLCMTAIALRIGPLHELDSVWIVDATNQLIDLTIEHHRQEQ